MSAYAYAGINASRWIIHSLTELVTAATYACILVKIQCSYCGGEPEPTLFTMSNN